MSLNGQRILVTGANGGIGAATCGALAREGAHVLMACRSAERGHLARNQLVAQGVPAANLSVWGGFDMLDIDPVTAAVARLPEQPLDRVFFAAGGWVYTEDYQVDEHNGVPVERTVFMNALGAHATLAALASRGLLVENARLVVMGGEGARGLGPIPKPQFDSADDFIAYARGEGDKRPAYAPPAALGAAKLFASVWAQRLARGAAGKYTVVTMSPGFTGGTGGTGGMNKVQEWVFQNMAFPVLVALGKAQWPEGAGQKCADVVSGRIGRHGDILAAPEGQGLGPLVDQKPLNAAFTDVAFQDALWDLACQAAGPVQL